MRHRTNEAQDCFDKSIKFDPNHSDPWYNKGPVYQAMGRIADADEAFAKASDIDSR